MRFFDTLHMSLGSIVGHKLRSSLTLVGIVLGIASIIAVMTAISVVQSTMEKEMSVLGAQVERLLPDYATATELEAVRIILAGGQNTNTAGIIVIQQRLEKLGNHDTRCG